MPKELPGFYYDAEKNRYFPYKGPIPGSSSKSPMAAAKPDESQHPCKRMSQDKLIQARELYGNIISCRKGKLNFQSEYQKKRASQPLIWKYKGTEKMANIALDHVVADVTTPQGLVGRDILLSGGANGLLCFIQIGNAGPETDRRQFYYKPDHTWPLNLDQIAGHKQLVRILGSSPGSLISLPSDITCIKASRKHSDDTMSKKFVITTLGSDNSPGSVFFLDLSKPLDFDGDIPTAGDGLYAIATYKQTLWTADCDPEGSRAVIGAQNGAALLDMETGASSWVFRCKSAVMSLQLDQSGKSVLCGLRNGAIINADTRQKQINRRTHTSSTITMPSSVCCLTSLICDRYFLASSMDGTIKLYDHRVIHRDPVQSYEGNVNSYTRIQLGVDPSEKVLMSGGEDCFLRLWNIMSGELILKERFMNSIPTAVSWPRNRGILSPRKDSDQDYRGYWQDHCWGAWLGSAEGIFYMDWL